MELRHYLLLLIFANITNICLGQSSIVAVGDAGIEQTKISFSTAENCNCINLANIIRTDLGMYRHKLLVYDSDLGEIERFDHDFQVLKEDGNLVLTYRLSSGKFEKKVFPNARQNQSIRGLAHNVADFIYEKIFRKRSIFKSKIFFISDIGKDKNGNRGKQLFSIDYDGHGLNQITDHDGYVFSPAISEDKKFAIYSVISNNSGPRNVNLYIKDLESGNVKILSSFKGINSGAVFVPGKNEIVLTLTHSGNAELYRMDIDSKNLFPLTRHFASDVDPSISPNGELLTFLSTRAGKPMIYTLNTSKTEYNVKRVSFVGDYNATPRFSPDGSEIVFSSWLDNRFDLFRLDARGMSLVRLTKDHGSNESPSYSPDGEFIVFSSQKILSEIKDVKNLYIMTRDGEVLKKLSADLGKAESPRWAK